LTRVSRILFDHIAIGVPAMSQAAPFLAGELGGIPDVGSPSGNFRWGTYAYDGGGSLEVLEPLGASGFLHRFLAERGPGIHHVTFKVPSLDAASARAETAGYDVIGRDTSDPEWREAFLHPKQALGIVVQLAQPGASDGAPSPSTPPPPTPPPGVAAAPPPVTVLGIRMRCQSRERAISQWSGVLQGEMADGPRGGLVFRWPGSPMRLVVDIDPVQNEGPIAIELRSARRLGLPAGPHPALGAVFVEEE
jgi:catechol 2,3-dioxygenase-like lactoylglutathione lyase family enzyme